MNKYDMKNNMKIFYTGEFSAKSSIHLFIQNNLYDKNVMKIIKDFLIPRSFSVSNVASIGVETICAANDIFYIATCDGMLQRFSNNGKLLSARKIFNTSTHLQSLCCVYYENELYFVSNSLLGIHVFSTDGTHSRVFGEEYFGAIDVKNGVVFTVCDDLVFLYKTSGEHIKSFECGKFDTINTHVQANEELTRIYVGLDCMSIEEITFEGSFRSTLSSKFFREMFLITSNVMLRLFSDGFLWKTNLFNKNSTTIIQLPETGDAVCCVENIKNSVLKRIYLCYTATKNVYIFEILP